MARKRRRSRARRKRGRGLGLLASLVGPPLVKGVINLFKKKKRRSRKRKRRRRRVFFFPSFLISDIFLKNFLGFA